MVGGRAPLSEEEILLLLRILPGVGDRRRMVLFEGRASRQQAVERALHPRGPVPAPTRALLRAALKGAAEGEPLLREVARIRDLAARHAVRILGMDEDDYPESLRGLHDPPAVLFLRGRTSLLAAPMVALVGSRRSTPAGRRKAYGLARQLADAGMTVLSGMALGIDGAAHRGGLDGLGSTAAVLGRGPDRAYPLTHAGLFSRIADKGLLITEFPPGTGARTHHFPRRNRILATLPLGVVVVEAGAQSGALLTADFALDSGVDVMVAAGEEDHPLAAGSQQLRDEGAAVVTSGAEVLEHLTTRLGDAGPGPAGVTSGIPEALIEPGMGGLYAVLGEVPQDEDALLQRTGLPLSQLVHGLMGLDLKGRARREGAGWVRWPPGS
jgi:DNA processing protein